MSWSEIEQALDGVLNRRWYTNHGPMAQALERDLEAGLGVTHAVVVTNPTIASIMLLEALDVRGRVGVVGTAPDRCRQALRWAGLHMVEVDDAVRQHEVGAILLTPDGDAAVATAKARLLGVALLAVDVLAPFGPSVVRLEVAGDPAGGGCVLTDDGQLAARLRNIRSSYGSGPVVAVRRTANGRMSEVQAALCLIAWHAAGSDHKRGGQRLRELC